MLWRKEEAKKVEGTKEEAGPHTYRHAFADRKAKLVNWRLEVTRERAPPSNQETIIPSMGLLPYTTGKQR